MITAMYMLVIMLSVSMSTGMLNPAKIQEQSEQFDILKVLQLSRPCDQPSIANFTMCNYQLPIDVRVADLVSRIGPNDVFGLFGNSQPGSGLVPGYNWWNEALHGVAQSPGVGFLPPTPVATSFPQVCLTSASFDVDLYNQIGQTVSTEARAFFNDGHAGLTFWTPNLNIFRDPRWGRGQETPGEDPYLTAQYVKNYVKGLQEGEDPNHLKVSACCKHYAAYSLEDWGGVDRHHFNAIVTQQDLADTYLPAFEMCASPDGAGASGMMCSYNAVNGIPSCANYWLLTTMARETWKFDGYITGDCGAVDDVLGGHHYTSTPDQTVYDVLNAGLDLDCGDFVPNNLHGAIVDNVVNMTQVNASLSRLFTIQMRLGFYDPVSVQPYFNLNYSDVVNTPANQALALQAALEGIVLLKNIDNTLPLPKTNISVALIGPNADATTVMQGNYYGIAPYLISPIDGISQYAKVNYQPGCDYYDNTTAQFPAACDAAKSSDVTVLVLGLFQVIESEGNDRTEIDLPGAQNQLIGAMAECSGKPVIVVIMSGGPVDLTPPKNNPNVGAILWVGYPGQSGGQALAMTLFGDNSPAGRLTTTVYPASFATQVSMFDMGMRPNASSNNTGRTYRFFTGEAPYSFGDGISYTTFEYQNATATIDVSYDLVKSHIKGGQMTRVNALPVGNATIAVTNSGQVTSDTVVLGFVAGPGAGQNGAPIKSLFGFTRLHNMKPGAQEVVTLPITSFDLSYVNEEGSLEAVAGQWRIMIESVDIIVNVA